KAYAAYKQAGNADAAERLRGEVRQLLPDEPEIGAGTYVGHAPSAPQVELPGYSEMDEPVAVGGDEAAGGEAEDEDDVVPLPTYDDAAAPPLPGYDEDAAEEPPYTVEVAAPPIEAAGDALDGLEATSWEAEETAAVEAPVEGLEPTVADVAGVDTVPEIEGLDSHRAEVVEDVAPLPLLDDDAGQRAEEPADVWSDGPADDWSDEPLDDAEDGPLPPLPLLNSPAADSRHAADDLYGVSTVDFSAE